MADGDENSTEYADTEEDATNDIFVTGWDDITPIPQEDSAIEVVKIAYEPKFARMMDLFRGILHVGEFSERVLLLTESILQQNPSNYTVWQYRRQCLKTLNSNLDAELDFMDTFADDNPKNYQVWHHRKVIAELVGNGERELNFTEMVIRVDSKNYHSWAHRQWVIAAFNLWENELKFIEQLLEEDIRNNSAWNQRWFVVHNGPEMLSDETVLRELEFCFNSINKVKRNESAWNYLRGLSNFHPEIFESIIDRLNEFIVLYGDENALALGLLADMSEKKGDTASLENTQNLFRRLIEVDKIRGKSWSRRLQECKRKLIVNSVSESV
eukprot:gene8027-10876_t